MKKVVFICLILTVALLPLNAMADDAEVNLRFNRYYDYEELAAALQELHEVFPKLTRLESAGKSFEGRDIWVITVFNPDSGPELQKPAMYIDGNMPRQRDSGF